MRIRLICTAANMVEIDVPKGSLYDLTTAVAAGQAGKP
jgi:hypothetical protein